MKFVVITHVEHVKCGETYFAYGPYVREMNLWFRHAEEVIIVAPLPKGQEIGKIDLPYIAKQLTFVPVPEFSFTSWLRILHAIRVLPDIILKIFTTMWQGDHLHLRCPGNMGLLACYIQMCFPMKVKTVKYAGNWDPQSFQPWTYQHQRWFLNQPMFSKNMKVLVYGKWPHNRAHIKPFFTASYSENEIIASEVKKLTLPIRLLFVGSLEKGKQPLIAAKVVQCLLNQKIDVVLNFYGEGAIRLELEEFVCHNKLENHIFIHGNTDSPTLKKVYQNSHFLVFTSVSEGWPKVVAEAMFWGCVPLTTSVSCVPEMLGNGSRGELVLSDAESIATIIRQYLSTPEQYFSKSEAAKQWSRKFTLERFEVEIKKLIRG